MGRFEEVITTRERLRELYKLPSHRAGNKAIDHIDDICRRFIAACPFMMVASRGADSRLDLSPKGDPPGFVAVLDERTLAVPDRLGNNRLDTFENLLIHPEVGLFFIIPGNGDTLRVSGKGQIVRDSTLQRRLSVNGKTPTLFLSLPSKRHSCIVRSASSEQTCGSRSTGRIARRYRRSPKLWWLTPRCRIRSPKCKPLSTTMVLSASIDEVCSGSMLLKKDFEGALWAILIQNDQRTCNFDSRSRPP
jgi:PPOX class probable FMN-dependent enzyme